MTDSESREYFDPDDCASGFVADRTFLIVGTACFVDDLVEVRVRSNGSRSHRNHDQFATEVDVTLR
ncbi:hypothetical protein ACFQY7_25920 [Actinomadura luteofluorescens]|uniref:hypothetical protein n=1 Tax=Actinomadura luteofluorescens TaxID=46163 RepID=UPI00363466EB